jgi:hypothetical protein
MSSDQKVTFTREQIEWLEREFPEDPYEESSDQLIRKAGQRSVLARIKQISRVETRYVPVHRIA